MSFAELREEIAFPPKMGEWETFGPTLPIDVPPKGLYSSGYSHLDIKIAMARVVVLDKCTE